MVTRKTTTAASEIEPSLAQLFGGPPPVPIRFWDESQLGPPTSVGTIVVRSPQALTRLIWRPGELGLARAFVAGDVDIEGDLIAVLSLVRDRFLDARANRSFALYRRLSASALRLGAFKLPPSVPKEELRLRGRLHSKVRDAKAIEHHYDVGNDFYRLLLGPSMTYSCARFDHADFSLEQAQLSKVELICRKLELDRKNRRFLDVGCGWGTLALHAALEHQAQVVAITLSQSQFEYVRDKVQSLQLEDLVEVRLQDYRDLRGETFDAISSVGMFEHVGEKQMTTYFSTLRALLEPGGRLLNHAISKTGGTPMRQEGFINRYVFPDGHLLDIANVVAAMEKAGYEVRDVESLREHYAETLRGWLTNLDENWDQAVKFVGERRGRVWRLYLATSCNAFAAGALAIHQSLGVIPAPDGTSKMSRTRSNWENLSPPSDTISVIDRAFTPTVSSPR